MFEPLAKSAKLNDGVVETLEQHTEYVVERLAGIMIRSPNLPEIAGLKNLWHIVFWAAVIHDFGKIAKGFQKVLRGEIEKYRQRHEVLSLAFLPWVASSEEQRLIALAVISHHRDSTVIEKLYETSSGSELLQELQPESIVWVAEWLQRVPNNWINKYNFACFGVQQKEFKIDINSFANLASRALEKNIHLYANINSGEEYFPHEPEFEQQKQQRRLHLILRGIITQADRMASAHAPTPTPLYLPNLERLTKQIAIREQKDIEPKAHQMAAQRQGNIIFSAPTGSGKTEAALGWAAMQQQESPRRLIYALPYQASLNAMHQRLTRDLQPKDGVAILHSRALQVLYRQAKEHGEDNKNLTKDVRRQRDFNKLHQPAVAVLTPYQILKAAFRLPGYEGVLTMLAGASLILDEIHAYEPSRLGMFLALTKMLHQDFGVQICAMTATMPTWLRQELEAVLSTNAIPPDQKLFKQSRRHKLELLDAELEDPQVIRRIVRLVKAGASVLVATNTVKKAQAVWQTLKVQLPKQSLLLHSRFTGNDRLQKEQNIQNLLDATKGEKHAVAVVATQVIEVSLDLDFDRIITEPAPLEALVQRFGRVNRRGRKGRNGIVPVTVLTQPCNGQRIYDDRLIERGLAQLVANNHAELDDLIVSKWLDAVYADDVLQDFQGKIQQHSKEFETNTINTLKPFAVDENLERIFDALFDGIEVLPKCFEQKYTELLETSPIEARGLMVSAPRWITGGLREFVQWNETLKVFIANLPYSHEIGMQWKAPAVMTGEWGTQDD